MALHKLFYGIPNYSLSTVGFIQLGSWYESWNNSLSSFAYMKGWFHPSSSHVLNRLSPVIPHKYLKFTHRLPRLRLFLVSTGTILSFRSVFPCNVKVFYLDVHLNTSPYVYIMLWLSLSVIICITYPLLMLLSISLFSCMSLIPTGLLCYTLTVSVGAFGPPPFFSSRKL